MIETNENHFKKKILFSSFVLLHLLFSLQVSFTKVSLYLLIIVSTNLMSGSCLLQPFLNVSKLTLDVFCWHFRRRKKQMILLN